MNMVMNFVLALQILTALAMIGLVLIQHGKGADMGASFGSGASGSLFGATGSANFLSRSTAVCAAVFFACTLALAYASNERPRAAAGSILDLPSAGASAPGAAASGAAAIPGAASSVARSAMAASAAPQPIVPARPVAASGAGAIPQK
ncbi:MAG: preprotein translocase subunit SecG [Pseudomonadota bacterium]|nr:preprotein translocase subunit SecG [Pseudomonadota bacterium]